MDHVKDAKQPQELIKAVRSAIGAKQYGYDKLLGDLVVKAATEIMPVNPKNFNVDSVRVVKIMGGSIYDSRVVRGMVFHREPEGIVVGGVEICLGCRSWRLCLLGDIKRVMKAKVAIFNCAMDIQQTETKGTVLLKNAKDLLSFSKGEEQELEKQFREIKESGVNVLVTGSGIGDLALHFINRMGLMVIKILSKFELRRLSKVTGATVMTRLVCV